MCCRPTSGLRPLPDDLTGQLCELHVQLVLTSNAAQPRLAKAEDRLAQRLFRTVLKSLITAREPIDRASDELLGTGPLRRAKEDPLKSVPGIRETIARTLIAELPQLGQIDRHRTAALAGVAQISRDSSRFGGQRRIPGGRIEVPLYVAYLLAILHNPPLSAR